MTQEALKLALEAMESVTVECNNFHHPKKDQNHDWAKCPPVARWDKAITAIKEALAQPEQEPVAWMDADGNVSDNNDHKCFPIPLYTLPPQRKPLTDEEIDNINYTSAHMLAREVEGKLKERNQ